VGAYFLTTLTKRIITAVILVGVLITTLFFLPATAAVFLLGFFLLVGGWEWSAFISKTNLLPRVLFVGLLLVLAGMLAAALAQGINTDWLLVTAVGWWCFVAFWLISGRAAPKGFLCVLAGVMALIPSWYAVTRLFQLDNGAWLFVWVVAIVAAADIGAYFVGRSLGRTKLAPTISPGKTREGLLGGVLCAGLAAAIGAMQFGFSELLFGLAGILIALLSVIGDLTVSMFKRSAGLKDSGKILPGHGGIMDRIDSLVAALPLFVAILLLAGLLNPGISAGS
jgi:phosphatidate cytidylyltransferase